MSHYQANHDKYGLTALCGLDDGDDLVTDETEVTCWECCGILGIDNGHGFGADTAVAYALMGKGRIRITNYEPANAGYLFGRWIGTFHVDTPDLEILRAMRAKHKDAGHAAAPWRSDDDMNRKFHYRAALTRHHQNQDDYAKVMG